MTARAREHPNPTLATAEELLDGTSQIHISNEHASSCRLEYLAKLTSGKTIYGVFNMVEGGVKFREPLSSIVIVQGEICI